jgi:formylglycine-generating enzyme required for sulfatase activity
MNVARPAALVVVLAACSAPVLPPQGQILLFIDTDAPVPGDKLPLFDRVAVDVLDETGNPCRDCSRIFTLDASAFRKLEPTDFGVSFGIARSGQSGWSARVRLYDSNATLDGRLPPNLPDGSPPPSVIDITFALPPIPMTGVVERTAFLSTDAVGLPGKAETQEGRPRASRVGTWAKVEKVACKGVARDDEVCVPGGAFWMGNPLLQISEGSQAVNGGDGTSLIRRLVVLSPFFLNRTEITVTQLRAWNSSPDIRSLHGWTGGTTGNSIEDFCTFTAAPGPNDQHPTNCITRDYARMYCRDHGGDLPSEAQFEYVASAMRSAHFVWGDDDPGCNDAVIGRSGWGVFGNDYAPCRPSTPPGGLLDVGSHERDGLAMGAAAIVDLVGNVSEWAGDMWSPETSSFWTQGGARLDPLCDVPSDFASVRGGSWTAFLPRYVAAAARHFEKPASIDTDVGFRCARADTR